MSAKATAPCVCGSYEDVGFMICCDKCDSWMHGPCVKITKAFSTGIDDYYCPRCKPTTTATTTTTTVNKKEPRRPSRSTQKSLSTSTSTSKSSSPSSSSTALSSLASSLSSSSSPKSSKKKKPLPKVQTSKLLELSDEILLWILTFVRCQKSICRISSTCKRFWTVAQDPYLWKHITLVHDESLRQHWDTLLQPRLLKADIFELNLVGEISAPVMIDALNIDLFTGLRILRLEDVQAYTVYRLASKLPWLRVFEARRIKGNSDNWDWRPFQKLVMIEELLLWRNEKPLQTFSLSQDTTAEISDDIYPQGEQHVWGGFVQLSSPASSDSGSGSDDETDGLQDDAISVHSNQSLGWSDDSHLSGQNSQRRLLMPRLKRLALINIVSPSTHRGTDAIMRNLVSRVTTFIYWNSFNILFPVIRTDYEQLRHLTLIEPSEPAWREGTWQEHAGVFQRMTRLESVTLVNTNMNRRFLIPILDAILSLNQLNLIRLVSTEDIETIQMIFNHVLDTQWSGQLIVSIQDDLGSVPVSRDWSVKATELVSEANKNRGVLKKLDLKVNLFRSEWDDDAGLKRLCLKAWQQTL
ncbi:hypothetical protein BGZ49_000312 [Haplosporangium sp. Z 27]|nr:hypothetical protein BGZ49_000312 [Haplosporangium sp. Z 27]